MTYTQEISISFNYMDEDLLTLMNKLGSEGTYDQVLNLDHSNVQYHRQTLKSRLSNDLSSLSVNDSRE